jgi:hypothetical protein
VNLRQKARGRDCVVRIPLVCNRDPATTVLAHLKRGGWCGTVKPPDLCAVWACSACHDVIDGRVHTMYTREQIDAILLGALCRQLVIYVQAGTVKW